MLQRKFLERVSNVSKVIPLASTSVQFSAQDFVTQKSYCYFASGVMRPNQHICDFVFTPFTFGPRKVITFYCFQA